MHVSFFFQLMMGFHMNFLMGIFANLRFSNTNSGFGMLNLILTVLTLLFLIALLVISIIKQKKIEEIVTQLKSRPHTPEELKMPKTVRQNRYMMKYPETKYWYFQKRGMNSRLSGLFCYYYQWNILKEILTIFFVVLFIDYPLLQLLPILTMTIFSILFLIFKRPFEALLRNIFGIVVESLYLLLFIGMLILRLTSESVTLEMRYKYLGVPMIVIICLILGAFIALGIF